MTFKKHNPGCPCCDETGSPGGGGQECCCNLDPIETNALDARLTSSASVPIVFGSCASTTTLDRTITMNTVRHDCVLWMASDSMFVCCGGVLKLYYLVLFLECAGPENPLTGLAEGTCEDYRLTYQWRESTSGLADCGSGSVAPLTCDCDPFALTFSIPAPAGAGSCSCSGWTSPVLVSVTPDV